MNETDLLPRQVKEWRLLGEGFKNYEAAVYSVILCVKCKTPQHHHPGGYCVYSFTTFEALYCSPRFERDNGVGRYMGIGYGARIGYFYYYDNANGRLWELLI